MDITALSEPAAHPLVLFRGVVGIRRRDLALRHAVVQGRPRLYGERVAGEVVGLEGEHALHARLPAVERLVGQPEDEVEIEAPEARCARVGDRLLHPLWCVLAIEKGELLRVHRLHAHREPTDAHLGQPVQVIAEQLGWIRLKRPLRAGRHVVTRADRLDDARHLGEREQARRSTPEEDAPHTVPARRRRPQL